MVWKWNFGSGILEIKWTGMGMKFQYGMEMEFLKMEFPKRDFGNGWNLKFQKWHFGISEVEF